MKWVGLVILAFFWLAHVMNLFVVEPGAYLVNSVMAVLVLPFLGWLIWREDHA